MRSLILGGARSGKSAYAERLAIQSGKEVVYLATAQAGDVEMQARIAHHQARRPFHWQLHEEQLALGASLRNLDRPHRIILLDCMSLWLSNLLFADGRAYPEIGKIEPPPCFAEQRADFLSCINDLQADLIMVSNEVGLGVIAMSAVTRWYVDEAGRLNQALAQASELVVFVAAGLPMLLKGDKLPC